MLMVFTERLQGILQTVEGARAIAVIGRDGIAVERLALSDEPNLDLATAQFTDIAKKLQIANKELEAGALREMIQKTDRYLVILTTITPEYFLMMILGEDGSLGRARFELRKAAAAFYEELA
jgi:predicted regulator of Ras-like GTPase activity (Roadblock/LC7/MglB family)